ncbi:MAG: hypothetical protein ABI181_01615 [Mycobacteriaceae bacterium]
MSEDTSEVTSETTAPKRAVAAVDHFVDGHGETRAVVQGVAFDQVRIVLVGADGALGDVLVGGAGVAAGVATAVVEASRATAAEWDRELAASITLGPSYRTRMAAGGGGAL